MLPPRMPCPGSGPYWVVVAQRGTPCLLHDGEMLPRSEHGRRLTLHIRMDMLDQVPHSALPESVCGGSNG
eukprot:2505237-Prorocentrum_lima.AAC.1